jgi:hypothetical protein
VDRATSPTRLAALGSRPVFSVKPAAHEGLASGVGAATHEAIREADRPGLLERLAVFVLEPAEERPEPVVELVQARAPLVCRGREREGTPDLRPWTVLTRILACNDQG